MAISQPIPNEPHLQLPITGTREGRRGVIVAFAYVADDAFSREAIFGRRWSMDGNYPCRCVPGETTRIRKVYLHHLVFRHYHGEIPAGLEIDHIDRNKLNNLPANLRAITHSANMANMQNRKRRNPTGFRGVTPNRRGRWIAHVTVQRKHIYLGTYDTPRQAADAVNRGYQRYFPEVQIPNP